VSAASITVTPDPGAGEPRRGSEPVRPAADDDRRRHALTVTISSGAHPTPAPDVSSDVVAPCVPDVAPASVVRGISQRPS
jgi:hypothetical protein